MSLLNAFVRNSRSWTAVHLGALLMTVGCGPATAPQAVPVAAAQQFEEDPHSNAVPSVAVVTHLSLDLKVDMDLKRLQGSAKYYLQKGHGPQVVFDTEGLDILGVVLLDGTPTTYSLGDSTMLGRPLRVDLPLHSEGVIISYHTRQGARALQWLEPEQTGGGKHPFLFTQGQAALTRSWLPCQDSPGIRHTYEAQVQVPNGLMALMSASNSQELAPTGVYHFKQDRPVPAYLISLAVGELAFRSTGPRTGVYAEPYLVDTAAWELAEMEQMLQAAEDLYGAYRWGRYDVIVLPPSFPFGGMENPMLTFATPTILSGDRSLMSLIAHELAHSWSGNLVTNATWNDLWLNEGFTVYFEDRIGERMWGRDYTDMLRVRGHAELLEENAMISASENPGDACLKLDLKGREPDEAMREIAYERGYAFLRYLEQVAGRQVFDDFVRGYFDKHAFQSMSTERFLAYLNAELLSPRGLQVNTEEWVYRKELPKTLIIPRSERFSAVEKQIAAWMSGTNAHELTTAGWSSHEWLHFIHHLPARISAEQLNELDSVFAFSSTGNSEILAAWLETSIRNGMADKVYPTLDRFLTQVGRRKFLVPLYTELARTEEGTIVAQDIYRHARPNYHSVSTRSIDTLLDWTPAPVEL
jgi:leukotriene-A4 hydrolase